MESLHPESPVASICGGGEAVTAAAEGLARAGVALAGRAAGAGLAADTAALCRDGPPGPGPRSATWSSALPVRS